MPRKDQATSEAEEGQEAPAAQAKPVFDTRYTAENLTARLTTLSESIPVLQAAIAAGDEEAQEEALDTVYTEIGRCRRALRKWRTHLKELEGPEEEEAEEVEAEATDEEE
jgi:hypothetical protein